MEINLVGYSFDFLNYTLVETIGWISVLFFVFAYGMLSIGKLKSDGYKFHSLNVIGALGLILSAAYSRDIPNLVVNLLWAIIGLATIFAKMSKRKPWKKN